MQVIRLLRWPFFFFILGSISFTVLGQTDESKTSDTPTVLVVPFSKYNFFAPPKMLREIRGEGTLNTDSLCAKYFAAFYEVLEQSDCAFSFEMLSTDVPEWTGAVRLETAVEFQQVNLSKSPELESLEWDADYVLFITRYDVESRIEDNQAAHSIQFDLLNRDLKRMVAGEATGRLFQSKIRDKQERTRVLLQSLSKRLCKKLQGKN